jgi:DNA helicase-2/ATP-dependent DNA helicase PcrA
MFHLGALSGLVKGIETPGWTTPDDFKYQMIALCLWGTHNARTEEAPLFVPPDAVSISTIHAAKGLEFCVVFLADVKTRRFPSQFAGTQRTLPFDGSILSRINPVTIADNSNRDGERRLMYVALTRAERYLFISSSKKSPFFEIVERQVDTEGGTKTAGQVFKLAGLTLLPCEYKRDLRLATSFSDLRYYLECPHDFYLRKVLGFAPSIDQAFGYGRGVHNLMREIHSNPAEWARLAKNPQALRERLDQLVRSGLFYLRYTTGDPLENMQKKALRIISDYVQLYQGELEKLRFEPEREFETLIEEEQLLVSGAIDIVRLDDPPRVTLIDFKSGEAESDIATKLTEEELKLQIGIYGLAAKHELEYEPDQGLVRYLGEDDPAKREMGLQLDPQAIADARKTVVTAAKEIRDRKFHHGPRRPPRNPKSGTRCAECDFSDFCGMQEAKNYRSKQ